MTDKCKGYDCDRSYYVGGPNDGKSKTGIAFELGRHGWTANNDCEDDENHADKGNCARPAETLDGAVERERVGYCHDAEDHDEGS